MGASDKTPSRGYMATYSMGIVTGCALYPVFVHLWCSIRKAGSTPRPPRAKAVAPQEESGDERMRLHHGALDQAMVTSEAPLLVMESVRAELDSLGIIVEDDRRYRLRCVRPGRNTKNGQGNTIYGEPLYDVGDEVRFHLELTHATSLAGAYSLDIRRLKGNLRSYQFLHDTIRDRVALSQ
ncbi:unnamed protein product [Peniophora sp. CBMAI 1063]|nr:unnamed protein product [Peniophora sp. CBMAI 1063]